MKSDGGCWVFHQAALGDFVLTFPILRALPKPVHMVAPWSKAKLAERLIEGVMPHNIERKLRDLPGLADAAQVITFTGNEDDLKVVAPHAAITTVKALPPTTSEEHVTDWYAKQVGVTPVFAEGMRNEDGSILIHPGSGGKRKCWPMERFAALVDALAARGRPCRMIVGEAEPEVLGAVRCESLDELVDAMAGVALYVGNDAGPTHLAAAMGLRTVALFGPTSPAVWRPRGPGARVIAPESPCAIEWLSVERVLTVCLGE